VTTRFSVILQDIRNSFGDDWLSDIYRDRIRTQRTRLVKIDVPEKINPAVIQYTLLGIELKVRQTRIACPDLATARYIRVFARCGIREFAVPYDITKISVAADDLETAWQRLSIRADEYGSGLPERSRAMLHPRLARLVRDEVRSIGAGELMPLFDRETKQRK
jgi:hypothetical protein